MRYFFTCLLGIIWSNSLYAQTPSTPYIEGRLREQAQYLNAGQRQSFPSEIQYIGPMAETLKVAAGADLKWQLSDHEVNESTQHALKPLRDAGYRLHFDENNRYSMIWKSGDKERIFIFAAPLLIQNTDSLPIHVSNGKRVPVSLEAKNAQGSWRPIELFYNEGQADGDKRYALAPGEVAVLSMPLYQGSFKTKLRYRVGPVYSNEFDGNIDEKQFSE